MDIYGTHKLPKKKQQQKQQNIVILVVFVETTMPPNQPPKPPPICSIIQYVKSFFNIIIILFWLLLWLDFFFKHNSIFRFFFLVLDQHLYITLKNYKIKTLHTTTTKNTKIMYRSLQLLQFGFSSSSSFVVVVFFFLCCGISSERHYIIYQQKIYNKIKYKIFFLFMAIYRLIFNITFFQIKLNLKLKKSGVIFFIEIVEILKTTKT